MRIVLVGAGLAAQRCAETLRANRPRRPDHDVRRRAARAYDRPPLSKAFLPGERPELRLRPDAWYRDHDVDFRRPARHQPRRTCQYDRR